MTPFRASLEDVVRVLAATPERCLIVEGLIAFRSRLHALGMTEGFQWIGGGFVEKRASDPKEIDVVTFFRKPSAWTTSHAETSAIAENREIFAPGGARARYRCDAYFVDLGHPTALRWITHWCGVYSHQKETHAWKGFLELPLAPETPGDFWAAALAEQRERLGLG
jgi:hypothetical protein